MKMKVNLNTIIQPLLNIQGANILTIKNKFHLIILIFKILKQKKIIIKINKFQILNQENLKIINKYAIINKNSQIKLNKYQHKIEKDNWNKFKNKSKIKITINKIIKIIINKIKIIKYKNKNNN